LTKYQKRISGPLLNRIDIHVEVPWVDYEKLSSNQTCETSDSIRARVQAAADLAGSEEISLGNSRKVLGQSTLLFP
jgi:predicted ATPase with chaperone activity